MVTHIISNSLITFLMTFGMLFNVISQNHTLEKNNNFQFKKTSFDLSQKDKSRAIEVITNLQKTDVSIEEKAYNILQFGRLLSHLGAYKLSLNYMDSIVSLNNRYHFAKNERFKFKNAAIVYFSMGNYPKVIELHKSSLPIAKKEGKREASHTQNSIGYIYLLLNDLDSSERYLALSLKNFEEDSVSNLNFYLSLHDNWALLLRGQEKYAESLKEFERILQISERKNLPLRSMRTRIKMSKVHILSGNFHQAKKILDAQQLSEVKCSFNEQMSLYELFLKTELAYYFHYGDIVNHSAVQHKIDEFTLLKTGHQAALLDLTFELFSSALWEKSALQEQLSVIENERLTERLKQRRIENSLIVGLSIGILLILWLVWLQRNARSKAKLDRAEIESLENEKKLNKEIIKSTELRATVRTKQSDLTDLSLEMKRQQQWVDEATSKLLYKVNLPGKEEELKETLNEIKLFRMTDQRQKIIYQNINELSNSFSTPLIHKYPKLTKSEVELCGLIRLNLSNKDIAVFKGIKYESIIMARKRLRKKLELKKEEDLYFVLKSI